MAAGSSPGRKFKVSRVANAPPSRARLMIYAGQDNVNLEAVDVSELVEEMQPLLKVSISKHATCEDRSRQESSLCAGQCHTDSPDRDEPDHQRVGSGRGESRFDHDVTTSRVSQGTRCKAGDERPVGRIPPAGGLGHGPGMTEDAKTQDLRSVLHHEIRGPRPRAIRRTGDCPRSRGHDSSGQHAR